MVVSGEEVANDSDLPVLALQLLVAAAVSATKNMPMSTSLSTALPGPPLDLALYGIVMLL